MRHACFGCTPDQKYSFAAPLTTALWVQHGYRPLMFRVGNWASREAFLSERAAIALGARIYPIDLTGCLWSGEWLSKFARFFACLVPWVDADDYVLTTDVDLAVLDASYMNDPDAERLNLFNASVYVGFREHLYAMCHVGAKARLWRDLVRPEREDVRAATMANIERWQSIARENSGCISDEMALRGMLMGWGHWPQACNFVSRKTIRCMQPAHRIEPNGIMVDQPWDYHLPRPDRGGGLWEEAIWNRTREIVFPYLSPGQRTQLDAYVAEYTGRPLDKEWGS
jgi:hypothetical protein